MASDNSLPPGFQEQYIETNGIQLHCMIREAETQPRKGTILLVHGFPEFWYGWRDQIGAISKEWRVVAPDLRGYNLSSKPEGVKNYDLGKVLVPDLIGLIDALGEQKVVMAAHDWGGMIAWTIGMFHPDRLSKLIILNAAHPMNFKREVLHNPKQQQASQYIITLKSPEAETVLPAKNCEYLQHFVFGTMVHPETVTQDERDAYVKAWTQPGAVTGMVNYYRGEPIGPPDFAALAAMGPLQRMWCNLLFKLKSIFFDVVLAIPAWFGMFNIKVPTLVLWGMKDCYLVPEMLDGLDRYVPELKVIKLPDCSHWVTHDAADEVSKAINEFIADL